MEDLAFSDGNSHITVPRYAYLLFPFDSSLLSSLAVIISIFFWSESNVGYVSLGPSGWHCCLFCALR